MGALHPEVQDKFQFKQDIYIAELAVDALASSAALPLPLSPCRDFLLSFGMLLSRFPKR